MELFASGWLKKSSDNELSMMAAKTIKKSRKRPDLWLKDLISSLAILFFIVVLALAVAYLITDPLLHPNLHPRLVHFYHDVAHYHPRLVKAMPVVLIVMFITAQTGAYFAPIWHNFRWRIKVLPPRGDRKSTAILDQVTKEAYAALLPDAWASLKDVTPGLFIKVPDVRGTHWELVDIDENKRKIRLAMRYVHDPLFLERWRLYPRKVLCTLALNGKGVRSEAEFIYHADSAMDYSTVLAIIKQTNDQIRLAVEREPQDFNAPQNSLTSNDACYSYSIL